VRSYHWNHGSYVNVVSLVVVERVKAIDDFPGKCGFAAAGDTGNANQDALVGGGFIKFPCGGWR
jgi:hypothetical protein